MLSLIIAGLAAGSILAIGAIIRVVIMFVGGAFNAIAGDDRGNR
jgi:hypothetical protein